MRNQINHISSLFLLWRHSLIMSSSDQTTNLLSTNPVFKVLSLLEACFELISSPSMKIQITSRFEASKIIFTNICYGFFKCSTLEKNLRTNMKFGFFFNSKVIGEKNGENSIHRLLVWSVINSKLLVFKNWVKINKVLLTNQKKHDLSIKNIFNLA